MKNRYDIFGCLVVLLGVMTGLYSCTDELDGIGIHHTRPSDVICFTASLSESRSASMSRSSSGHLEIEQEEWLVGVEEKQSASRGNPVTLLNGSAGVIGYVYDTWSEDAKNGTKPSMHNKQFNFDGDALTANSEDERWQTFVKKPDTEIYNKVLFHVYAPYNLSGGTLSADTIPGTPTLTYIVNNDVTEQHDLIVSSWEGAKGTNYGTGTDGKAIQPQSIPLVFEHALTAVKFNVGFACTVTKLEVKGIYHKGTYTFGEGWNVDKTSTSGYNFTFGENGTGASLLTQGETTLMMIPQKLGPAAEVILTYDDGKTITATLTDKVWEAGKMITYTIHKDEAPATIYFDLAAGNVMIGVNLDTYETKGTFTHGNDYQGYVYRNGVVEEIKGAHSNNNVYYVYQSSTSTEYPQYNKDKTGYESSESTKCRIPDYRPVTHGDKSWSDFITNNTSVDDVIEMWDDGQNVRDDQTNASKEQNIGIARVRDVGRTHTKNHILIKGKGTSEASKQYKLIVDDIYSTWQYHDTNAFRGRDYGGITYYPNGYTNLTVNFIGDNRVGYVHINNQSTDFITFEGTGTLTVANADFITPDDFTDDREWDDSYYGILKKIR